MIHVVIGRDICPVGRSTPYFIDGDAPRLFNDLLNEFEKADLTISNLECPLIRKESPILKSGPVLGADSVCVNGFKNAHICNGQIDRIIQAIMQNIIHHLQRQFSHCQVIMREKVSGSGRLARVGRPCCRLNRKWSRWWTPNRRTWITCGTCSPAGSGSRSR